MASGRAEARDGDAADGRLVPAPARSTARSRCSPSWSSSSSSARCSGCRPRRRSSPGWRPRTSAARTWARSAASAAVGFALGPFIGLQLRGAYGDNAAWFFFAVGLGHRRRDRSRSRPRRVEAAGSARRGGVLARCVLAGQQTRCDPGAGRERPVPRLGAECALGRRPHRRRESRARGRGERGLRRRPSREPGRRLPVRPRRRPGAARSLLALPAPRASRARRGSSSCPGRSGAASRSRSSSIYELHVGTFSRGGDVRRSRALPARAARAGRHGGRADAGRDLPRASAGGATTASTRTRRIPPTAGRTGSPGWSRPRIARAWA